MFGGDRFNNVTCRLDDVPLLQRLNVELSINSGQEFLWERIDDAWYGVYGHSVIRLEVHKAVNPNFFPQEVPVPEIFRLEDDMDVILAEICKDPLVKRLVKSYPGLRLMRQNPEQCLISFLCASNTNIPRIRRMLRSLCAKFGEAVYLDGHEFNAFPSADALARATEVELRDVGLGYRAKAVRAAAVEIARGSLDLESLKKTTYEDARERLMQVYGVGPKIADCVLLFSLEKLDAFPIDVWIARALSGHYDWLHGKKINDKLSPRQYDTLSSEMRQYFGKYGGYAQQYLYYHMRQRAGKRW